MTAPKWETSPTRPNMLLDGDGFFISYNPNTGSLLPMFRGEGDGAETALCKDGAFLILNGDFRKEYEEAFPRGYEACLAVYEANRSAARSSWSSGENEDPDYGFLLGRIFGLGDS